MKVLVIGGMHGNEPLGPEVVRLLRAKDSKVDTLIANEQALQANTRFMEVDLNRSFPGDVASAHYEAARAAAVLAVCRNYDVVLDFHNTHCPGNDCAFVGETAQGDLFDVSAWLGLNRVIVADYDCINKYAPNCVSIEISLSSDRMDAAAWVAKIEQLAAAADVPRAKNVEKFRFVYRMTLDDKERLGLDQQRLEAFTALKPRLASKLGVSSPAYPIFVADAYTPYNFGGILNRLDI